MTVRAVRGAGEASAGARGARRASGKVARAARAALAELDSDHAAAELLAAVVERLAQDIDEAGEVRDRVAASRELREVLEVLDSGVIPPKVPAAAAGPASPGGGALPDDGDPFGIGVVPPGVGDAP